MKTNKFWFVMAAAAVLTVMSVFTSCSKDDDPYLPEVIESEVLDSGLSSDVQETSGTQGTKLSYESWIVVKGQTRAAFENKVSVTLNDSLNLVNTEMPVSDFQLGSLQSNILFREGPNYEKDFVTVTDSVLVYHVQHDNFGFDYRLVYQVAVYNDGITRQIMPYHKFDKDIADNGYKITDMDAEIVENRLVYARKLYQHSITVTIDEKDYEITANIILKRLVSENPEDCVVKCELIDSGTQELTYEEDRTTYMSWIKVKQTLMNGKTREKTFTVENLEGYTDTELLKFQRIPDKNLTKVECRVEDLSDKVVGINDVIYTHCIERQYVAEYNYFTINFNLTHYEAVYDDGISTIKFPTFKHENFIDEVSFVLNGSFTEGGMDFEEYWLTHTITADFGAKKHTGVRNCQVIAPKQ